MILRTLTPFLSLLIAVLLFMFVIQPQYGEVAALKAEVVEYQDATQKYNSFLQKLDEKLAQKTEQTVVENERLDALVLDEIDTSRTLVDLEAIAKKYHLLFGNISVEEGDIDFNGEQNSEQTSSELAAADISFEIVGSYEQFKNFLKDIENSLTLYEVVNMKFTSGEQSLFQQYSLKVRVYALPKS